MSFATKTMVGLSVLASTDPAIAAHALAGKYDIELICSAFHTIHGASTTVEGALADKASKEAVNNMKDQLRENFQRVIDAYSKEVAINHAIDENRKLHDGSAHGTVAEIATKYNISKAQVRKIRADGTLDDFIEDMKVLYENT